MQPTRSEVALENPEDIVEVLRLEIGVTVTGTIVGRDPEAVALEAQALEARALKAVALEVVALSAVAVEAGALAARVSLIDPDKQVIVPN